MLYLKEQKKGERSWMDKCKEERRRCEKWIGR